MSGVHPEFGVDPAFLPPAALWQALEPLLPEDRPKPKGGRPRMRDRTLRGRSAEQIRFESNMPSAHQEPHVPRSPIHRGSPPNG